MPAVGQVMEIATSSHLNTTRFDPHGCASRSLLRRSASLRPLDLYSFSSLQNFFNFFLGLSAAWDCQKEQLNCNFLNQQRKANTREDKKRQQESLTGSVTERKNKRVINKYTARFKYTTRSLKIPTPAARKKKHNKKETTHYRHWSAKRI
jgi:hypothetical protein